MTFFANFKKSALELKNLRTLCVTALLIALDLALKMLKIYIPPNIKISMAFVAVSSIGMLFGPTVAGLACVATDIIGYLMNPDGGFSPLFTVIEVAGGVIYGCFLYNFKPVKLDFSSGKSFGKSLTSNLTADLRIIFAKVTVAVLCNLIMTPAALQLSKGQFIWEGFAASVSARLIKNAISVPIEVVILMVALPAVWAAYNAVFKKRKTAT